MHLQQPTLQQAPQIQELCVQTILHSCQGDYNPQQLQVWSQAVDQLSKWQQLLQEQYFLVAQKGAKVVGFASLKDNGYINYLYVHHQHLRQGIAQQLFQALLEQAQTAGATQLSTHASKTARPFFEQKGFEVVTVCHPVLQGIELENYEMKKKL